MKDYDIKEIEGFYYELAYHDITQYPMCPDKHSRCITSSKAVQTYPDGQKFVNDTWHLSCFGKSYPEELLFNVTDEPGHLKGYISPRYLPILKHKISSLVFPDTVVDYKPGLHGWVIEIQCMEGLGRVLFVALNFYSKDKSEANFNEMNAAARARGLGFYMDAGFGLSRVDHSNCPNEPPEPPMTRTIHI